ncbi:GDSL-type esterase/lipase family protein [Marininema halotolerans]|uniref:Lysophospholipase L1 n=1 Tax=Marininema halotolerans TaxID=1155944 RepID=A0A1I6TJ64_9BACL|nr:GDSL-type esterase/lipase family protein [Marininema halotolerans]SFS89047.1 Lysophospholipase L1 [Marininema halotolerans]
MHIRRWGIPLVIIVIVSIGWAEHYHPMTSAQTIKEKRILALGDSLTYGYGDREHEGYVGGLKRALNREDSDTQYRTTNAGIYGLRTDGVLKQLAKPEMTQSVKQADGIILFIGTNDFIQSTGGNMTHLYRNRLAKGEKRFVHHLHRILTQLRKQNSDAPITLLGLYDPYPNRVVSDPYIAKWNQASRNVIKHYHQTRFVPTQSLFEHRSKREVFSDELHPNHQGYQLIVQQLLRKGRIVKG